MQLSFWKFYISWWIIRYSFTKLVLVNSNVCGKLISSLESPIKFGERFKVNWVLFSIFDFSLLSCGLDNFTFKVLYWVIYIDIINQNKLRNTFAILSQFQKSKTSSWARFPVRLIYMITFGLASSACCLLKPTAIVF